MRVHVSTFREPKRDCHLEDCEDASAVDGPPDNGEANLAAFGAAISDGASEAMLAKYWSTMLADELASARVVTRAGYHRALGRAIKSWDQFVEQYTAGRVAAEKPIQWYEEPGLARGAYATALSIYFQDASEDGGLGNWCCFATGDSCLFQFREGELAASHPVATASDFGTSPALVPSRPLDFAAVRRETSATTGTWHSGDMFVLATDAVSAWLLTEIEAGAKPWEEIRDLGTSDQPPFPDWVADLRHAGRMKDDDATLVRIDFW